MSKISMTERKMKSGWWNGKLLDCWIKIDILESGKKEHCHIEIAEIAEG